MQTSKIFSKALRYVNMLAFLQLSVIVFSCIQIIMVHAGYTQNISLNDFGFHILPPACSKRWGYVK